MVSMVRAGRPDPSEAEPPTDELPGIVPTVAMLGRSADVVVSVDHVLVHTTGVRIAIGVRFSDTDVTLAATWPAAGVRARRVSISHDAIAGASRDVASLFP